MLLFFFSSQHFRFECQKRKGTFGTNQQQHKINKSLNLIDNAKEKKTKEDQE